HPYSRSWGYQRLGYFAPTSRFGIPEHFMHLVDELHRRGFGVILDWVSSHFPSDAYGLAYYDGSHPSAYADPKQGYHPDWKSYIFDFGKGEVRSFLASSALFWVDVYHADGLRVDAVASMVHLDYSRKKAEWTPYEFDENFVLPLSHDEVVYGKRSLLDKMPGDTWEKFANLRVLYGYMYGHPGKKLLFMGGEFGQWDEWDFEKSLDWHLAKEQSHKQLQLW